MIKMIDMLFEGLRNLPLYLKILVSLCSGVLVALCVLSVIGCSLPPHDFSL